MLKRIVFGLLACSTASFGQVYKDVHAQVEDRVKDVLARMTLEEKIDYIGGYKDFNIRGISRLGLPEIKMTDGPVGTRNDGKTTAYPATILEAATWDAGLAYRLGEALGKDARQRGVHILLAPGVNIYRAPMNGRNFEYLGEDPFLAGKMAAQYIRGVQSQKVVATVKHFAGNNQEWDRNNVSSDIDERTLHEIYLPAFKIAVQEGEVGAVMDSYNLVNGEHATQNNHLNNEILKKEWRFDGILMSDWVATYDGVAAANGGLDLEMPSGAFMNRKTLLPAVRNGQVSEAVIDDKVRRILRIIFRFGFYDNKYTAEENRKEIPENKQVALELAQSGIVLLKNEGKILPLSKDIKSIAVVGPNANSYVAGGGSSYTQPFASVSLVEGIQEAFPGVRINYVSGAIPTMENYVDGSPFYTAPGSKEKGLKADYFNNQELKGKPVTTMVDAKINHDWPGSTGIKGIGNDHFSIRFTGVLRPEQTGTYKIGVRGDDGYRLFIDDKQVIDLWADHAATLKSVDMPLKAGQEYKVTLEYYENGGGASIAMAAYQEKIDFSAAEEAAAHSDAVILSMGFDASSEGEGFDRTFELPPYQEMLIKAIQNVNPNTIVVLNSGGSVDMSNWLPRTKALLQAWYPGEMGGTAVASILSGKVNPSGKLPATFENKWADNPTFNTYYDEDKDKRVSYNERLNIGYRHYDTNRVKPLFPFGFGLSYTTFEYSNIKIAGDLRSGFILTYTIKNTGNYDGAESSQVYVHQNNPIVTRPMKELKGFSKVFLKIGESKTVTVRLDESAFSYFSLKDNQFIHDKDTFDIMVGAASDDIRLKTTVSLK